MGEFYQLWLNQNSTVIPITGWVFFASESPSTIDRVAGVDGTERYFRSHFRRLGYPLARADGSRSPPISENISLSFLHKIPYPYSLIPLRFRTGQRINKMVYGFLVPIRFILRNPVRNSIPLEPIYINNLMLGHQIDLPNPIECVTVPWPPLDPPPGPPPPRPTPSAPMGVVPPSAMAPAGIVRPPPPRPTPSAPVEVGLPPTIATIMALAGAGPPIHPPIEALVAGVDPLHPMRPPPAMPIEGVFGLLTEGEVFKALHGE